MLAALFLAALMMRVDEGNADDDSQAHISALLILVVLAVFVVLFFYIIKEVRSELRKDFKAIRSSTMAKSPNSQSPKEVALKEISGKELLRLMFPNETDVQIEDYTSRGISMDGNLTNDTHTSLGTTL